MNEVSDYKMHCSFLEFDIDIAIAVITQHYGSD